MRVPALRPSALREEVCQPHREVAVVCHHIIRADGIVRHNEAALNNIDEVRLRIGFQHLEQTAYFERIVKSGTVTRVIVSVKLRLRVSMPNEP